MRTQLLHENRIIMQSLRTSFLCQHSSGNLISHVSLRLWRLVMNCAIFFKGCIYVIFVVFLLRSEIERLVWLVYF